MIIFNLLRRFIGMNPRAEEPKKVEKLPVTVDPLDLANVEARGGGFEDRPNGITRTIKDFPILQSGDVETASVRVKGVTMDSASFKKAMSLQTMDNDGQAAQPKIALSNEGTAGIVQSWFNQQTFIGFQDCALIAQHWLVEKCCSMPVEDAVRNGYEIKSADGNDLDPVLIDKIVKADLAFNIKAKLIEYHKFMNVFGIRIAFAEFEHPDMDDDFYTKPFNPDGIMPGSYKGITQVDPYWAFPLLDARTSADPMYRNFYDPDYWQISGRKIHRSHLIIIRGPEVADILKPTYIFGGVPLTQRIYERVYAAERTANEGPLLAMTKRTTALHVDLAKVAANVGKFMKRLGEWTGWRDNFGVKVLGKDEVVEQIDTSLADLDSVISGQYQLVAGIAEVPAVKLLGTSPKGFNATGEFEMKSYHEKLESVQEQDLTPLVNHHHLCFIRSELAEEHGDFDIEINWKPVNTMDAAELADVNQKKATTDGLLIDKGIISADEARDRLKNDREAGYISLADDEADTELVNIDREKVEAQQTTAEGSQLRGEAATAKAGVQSTDPLAGTIFHTEGDDELPPGGSYPLVGEPGSESESALAGTVFEQNNSSSNVLSGTVFDPARRNSTPGINLLKETARVFGPKKDDAETNPTLEVPGVYNRTAEASESAQGQEGTATNPDWKSDLEAFKNTANSGNVEEQPPRVNSTAQAAVKPRINGRVKRRKGRRK
ncbi:minor head protein [Burkholderia phage Bm1]